MAVSIYCWL